MGIVLPSPCMRPALLGPCYKTGPRPLPCQGGVGPRRSPSALGASGSKPPPGKAWGAPGIAPLVSPRARHVRQQRRHPCPFSLTGLGGMERAPGIVRLGGKTRGKSAPLTARHAWHRPRQDHPRFPVGPGPVTRGPAGGDRSPPIGTHGGAGCGGNSRPAPGPWAAGSPSKA